MATKRVFKSKKKISGTRGTFRKWSDWDEGDILLAEYVSEGEDQYGNSQWVMKVIEATFTDRKLAKSLIDKNLILNSSGQLNKAMDKASVGEVVQIIYNGTSVIEKGKFKGKESHLMDVEIMEEEGEDSEDTDFEDEEENEDDDMGDYL